MVNLTSLSLLLAPAILAPAILAAPTSPASPLEKRSTCGVIAGVTYYKGGNCETGSAITTINWKNSWSSYNYQRTDARSFAITSGDYWDINCALYDGYNGQGNYLGGLEWNTGYRICKPLGAAGANVKSIVCWGNNC
ncbi:uncharacterized oxidoreductase C162.03 [Aspergillus udagawae]|jgi:hypothetical protein|uniref:Uncharacterized oxidoreductase C162.03 n=1 Tax=Aspergillus udagawae TaxID=91492 RepID=A0ABQ1B1A3_9EURO|nr:uncharacterized oxidoreductase C162.03 [Aspergillus udagawae]GFF91540.1 uncharacterized oxidoreductase C162.03 [Aspergillus udagawae]GFG09259.1 uncharacterized oxidoreductase C162.03 [Aspergillus udagawae]